MGSGRKQEELVHEFNVIEDEEVQTIVISYPMGESPALWDEFNPNLYRMHVELNSDEGSDMRQVQFGMREFNAEGKRFSINGRPLFLRGTL